MIYNFSLAGNRSLRCLCGSPFLTLNNKSGQTSNLFLSGWQLISHWLWRLSSRLVTRTYPKVIHTVTLALTNQQRPALLCPQNLPRRLKMDMQSYLPRENKFKLLVRCPSLEILVRLRSLREKQWRRNSCRNWIRARLQRFHRKKKNLGRARSTFLRNRSDLKYRANRK